MSWLWKLFLPSWGFFDRAGARFRVMAQTPSGWMQALLPPPAPSTRFVFNPEGNLWMYRHGLLPRLVEEPTHRTSLRELKIALRDEGFSLKAKIQIQDAGSAEWIDSGFEMDVAP